MEHLGFSADLTISLLDRLSLRIVAGAEYSRPATVYIDDVRLLGRLPKEMFPQGITPRDTAANDLQMESCLQENVASQQSFVDLDRWMERYQQADPEAPAALVGAA